MQSERSNLYLKSNVYWREPNTRLIADRAFTNLVRGRKAVSKLLTLLGVPVDQQRHYNAHVQNLQRKGTITWVQVSTLETHIQCGECLLVPSGITFTGGLDFRCDRGCAGPRPKQPIIPKHEVEQERPRVTTRKSLHRRLRVPVDLAKGLMGRRLQDDLDWAIEACKGRAPRIPWGRSDGVGVTVEIDASLAKRYSDTELNAFLTFGLQKRKASPDR
jgi:hypothetical protein